MRAERDSTRPFVQPLEIPPKLNMEQRWYDIERGKTEKIGEKPGLTISFFATNPT
jgi:hypothetical protein